MSTRLRVKFSKTINGVSILATTNCSLSLEQNDEGVFTMSHVVDNIVMTADIIESYVPFTKYVNQDSEIVALNVGDRLFIGNQMKPWILTRNNKGYAFVHDTLGIAVLGWMFEGKDYLLATTSGAARNGLIHRVKEASNKLEKFLQDNKMSLNILTRTSESRLVKRVGGCVCRHTINPHFDDLWSDGTEEALTKIPLVEKHSNQYHIGCVAGYWDLEVKNFNYIILSSLSGRSFRVNSIIYRGDLTDDLISIIIERVSNILDIK